MCLKISYFGNVLDKTVILCMNAESDITYIHCYLCILCAQIFGKVLYKTVIYVQIMIAGLYF